jgi:hypothetical protein
MSTAALSYRSPWATGAKVMPTPTGNEVINVLLSHTMTSAEVDALAADDIITMGYLPENCTFVDAVCAMTTGIDTGSAFKLTFGVVNAGETDLDTALQADILTDGTTSLARVTLTETMLLLGATATTKKKLGYKVVVAAGTAAAGTVYLSLSYRSTQYGYGG